MTEQSPSHADVDLTNCDREPIHIPGRIQSFGALLAFTPDWLVARASENATPFLGLPYDDLIGRDIGDLFSPEIVHHIRGSLQMLSHGDSVERIFGIDLRQDGTLFDLAVHLSGRTIVMEAEQHSGQSRQDYIGYIRPMIDRIRKADTIENVCAISARQIKMLTGFGRVMVYRFLEDGSGQVIAENKSQHMESFLGLRYPASDIPRQARALYSRNLLRIIADISDPGCAVLPATDASGEPLDLSLSTLRAVSPIHIEYLRNMGVGASLSISIMVQGKLWGLIACHHNTPRSLSLELRSAAELFAQLFGYILTETEAETARLHDVQARMLHDRIMAELADGQSIADNFSLFARTIKDAIPYTGIVSWTHGHFQSEGLTPTKEQFKALAHFLNTTAVSDVFATQHLSRLFAPASDYIDVAAGVLALPVSRSPRDYIVLFREPVTKDVKWGGNPEKPVTMGPNGDRLTPRESFAAWKQTVHDESRPWSERERRAADSLRVTLLEVVLRLTDAANQERTRSQQQQELLIAELNHRVRNILNLIRGLINQSSDSASVSEFTAVVGGRIHALARAHDQITNDNWQPSSARDLIETEVRAYLGTAQERVSTHGIDAMLTPEAFTTLSLVIHEMMTNAVKYGALSNETGHVAIQMTESEDGALIIDWAETGGPPVKAPTRKGFGTTITERSIAYDLKGASTIDYAVTGLRARFDIPAHVISRFRDAEAAALPEAEDRATGTLEFSGHVLIVEDNMIIALDAQDMFERLGADTIDVAPTSAEALQMIAAQTPDFALLDVNLGLETSERVATRLLELGVPFAFATGYGERTSLSDRFPDAAFLRKPYEMDTLVRLLRATG
ncbi:HWE histidine kinase domain-containing protein [Algimonas porphyrae]|uniref:histidine kinase n=1 Tax=Algimonas porphyrae TaxID=1128113 RepID=A0ABQ5V4T9_9PROT|nr:HWE histidine kinase domain-containing protein [Algimonas porphyrae]GLQ21863.1 signal transduction histidine kinase [Algimonas porphyrae]